MKIKKITVKNYGPVKDFFVDCKNINLIYGKNEAGKTALIDAITSALFQKKSIFPGQGRFEENSSATLKENITLVLEHLGKEYTFPGSFKLEKLMNLPHYHLAGLFIIRAGDLTLREEDRKWQDRVKEFLSGVPVNIERIKEKIGEEVGLTPTGEWSDRQPIRKKSEIKEKEQRKKAFLSAIDRLESMHQKEKILKEKYQKREKLRRKIEKIKLLRSYLLHKRVKEAFSNWSYQKMRVLDYERYLEEDRERWLKKERERQSLLDKKKAFERQLQEMKVELDKTDEEKLILEKEERKLVNQKDRVAALSIFQDVKKLVPSKEDIALRLVKLPLYGILGSALVLGGAIFLFTWGLKNLNSALFLLFPLFGVGICFSIFSYLIKKEEFNLKKLENSILERGKRIWPNLKSIDDIIQACDSFDAKLSQVEAKLEYITEEEKKKSYKLKEKEGELESIEKRLQDVEEEIKKLRDKTGLSSLFQLEQKLKEKEKIKLDMESKENALRDYLGTDDPSIWEKEAKKEVVRPEIDEEELIRENEVERELSMLNRDIQDLTAQITSFTQGELGRLNIKEVTGLWKELKKIEDDLTRSYFNKDAALLAWDILDKVSKEMEEILLNTVSDDKNGVSFYFKLITSGRYTKVRWDEGSIYVKDAHKREYPIDALSTGTQDQLFFSLRLGILKRGFPEGTFILLDDAFLTSDATRRKHQIRICRRLAEEGWQIFYFTVDEALRDLFCKICEVEPINL